MHQRKAEMAKQADAFIAMPGWLVSYKLVMHLSPTMHTCELWITNSVAFFSSHHVSTLTSLSYIIKSFNSIAFHT